MENLNKENFWNEMKEKYPVAMDDFCKWIDEYKKENDWNYLFYNHRRIKSDRNIKFHDIPLAMQFGIWVEYLGHHTSEPFSNEYARVNIEEDLGDITELIRLKKMVFPQQQ